MSKPNYIRHDKSPISVIIHAESLANYIYQITNNERQFGKVFRYSLSADMRNVATNIVKSISKAVEIRPRYKGEYKRRMKFRLEAYESIVEMKALIRLAKNVANIKNFEIELERRYASTAAAFILTIIGLSLSSRKVKGGMGVNIGIGLVLSFSYILFTTITSTFAVSGYTSPFVAMWIPNILYTFIAIYLYRKASI